LERKALEAIESLTRKNIESEKRYQQTLIGSQQVLAKRAKDEETRVGVLKKKQEELLDIYSLYDKKTGELLGAKERSEKLKEAPKKLAEFIRLATKDKPIDVGAMLNFANLSSRVSAEMDQFRIQELLVSDAALQKLNTQVQQSLNKFYLEVPEAKAITAATGIDLTGAESAQAAMSKITETLIQQKTAQAELAKTQSVATAANMEFGSSLSRLHTSAAKNTQVMKVLAKQAPEFANAMADAMIVINAESTALPATTEQVEAVFNKLKEAEGDLSWMQNFSTESLQLALRDVLEVCLCFLQCIQINKNISQS